MISTMYALYAVSEGITQLFMNHVCNLTQTTLTYVSYKRKKKKVLITSENANIAYMGYSIVIIA
jgi:hypothetical protein